jgi:hypothetical protein
MISCISNICIDELADFMVKLHSKLSWESKLSTLVIKHLEIFENDYSVGGAESVTSI